MGRKDVAGPEPSRVGHAAARGVVAAMSMTGLRAMSMRLGLLESTPPEMVSAEAEPSVLQRLSPARHEAVVILMHWAYGAAGGALFGALPARVRFTRFSGPVFGTVLWFGFDFVLAPAMRMQVDLSARERVALMVDHLLYGAVLSELRTRPQK